MDRISRDNENTPTGELSAEDSSIHGLGSLLSGHPDGISLNGESVILPSEFDDMSFNTSAFESRVNGFRIVGIDDSTVGEPAFLPTPEKLNDKRYMNEEKEGCVPSWLSDAPSWLKIAIVVSSALLIGACVLLTVAAALNAAGNSARSDTSSMSSGNMQFPPWSPPILIDSPQPTTQPTTSPSTSLRPTFKGETFAPSMHPSTPLPSTIPSAPPSAATLTPTEIPSNKPSNIPTQIPSSAPTNMGSSIPTIFSSLLPTVIPSFAPSEVSSNNPSSIPSIVQSNSPSAAITAPAITGTKTVFYLTAGRPLDDDLRLFEENLGKIQKDSDFMVHLGDFNKPFITECVEESYEQVNLLFARSTVPVYFIPGDNEYNDCPDPNQAMGFWKKHLLDYELEYWPTPSWEVLRDEEPYDPNFAFVLRRVLYVGINLVGGKVHDEEEWKNRQEANLNWIQTQFSEYRKEFDVMILFTHADPNITTNDDFFKPFFERVRTTYNFPVVLVHRNLGMQGSGLEQNYEDIQDLVVLVVKGDAWPPMKVEIDTRSGSFSWDQGNWFVKETNGEQ
mmetsp:Transcript_26823/g.30657  ORF Transcript_26823/g.30657 Transcript_26823/m.30657 type:complete len:561 (-) Transcript_26823:329-2011(-)